MGSCKTFLQIGFYYSKQKCFFKYTFVNIRHKKMEKCKPLRRRKYVDAVLEQFSYDISLFNSKSFN